MTDATTDDLDIDALVTMLGGLPEHLSERPDLPLTEQVQLLLDLYRHPYDLDIVITEVLVKLITALADKETTR